MTNGTSDSSYFTSNLAYSYSSGKSCHIWWFVFFLLLPFHVQLLCCISALAEMAKVLAASVVEAHSVMSEGEDPNKDAGLSTEVAEVVSARTPFCQLCFWDQ